mgnify:CR=1 FL=1
MAPARRGIYNLRKGCVVDNIVYVAGEIDDAIRAIDDNLRFVFLPNKNRASLKTISDDVHDEFNTKVGGYVGCFGVVHMVGTCGATQHDDSAVFHSNTIPYIIHKFDGQGGEPLKPGQWFRDAMFETDRCRLGPQRDRNVDDLAEKRVIEEKKKRDRFAYEQSHNDIMFNAFASAREELGFTTDNEEMYGFEKDADAWARHQSNHDLVDRKAVRYMDHRSDEELL